MAFLRDRWHRSYIYQYFAVMEPMDRATALIVIALLLAWSVACVAIVRSREPDAAARSPLPARPFLMDFAGAGPRPRVLA